MLRIGASSHSFRRNGRMLVIALLAVSTVVPVVLLSWRTHGLSQSHREVAEAALADYSALAANEFAQRLHRTLTGEKVVTAFRPFYQYSGAYIDHYNLPKRADLFVVEGLSEEPEEEPEPWEVSGPLDLEATILRNAPYYLVSRYFYYDLHKSQMRFGEGEVSEYDPLLAVDGSTAPRAIGQPSEQEQEWVAELVREFSEQDHGYYGDRGLLLGEYEGELRVYMCSLYTGPRSTTPSAGYGFEVRVEKLQELFEEAIDLGPVLPGPLIQRVKNPQPAIITVFTAGGQVLFRTAEPVSGSRTARRGLGPAFGGLVVEAALMPEAFEQLLIGGLPPTRRPEIWVLLGSSLLLLGLTVALMRRELNLARLRSDFVASVSHELRTPLTQIRLFADTLLLGRFRSDEDRQRCLRVIDRETQRLDHLLENVLQFGRTERQEVDLELKVQPLRPLVEEVRQSFEPIAQARRVTVEAAIEGDPVAAVDEHALRRILLNLLDNAVKYGPLGQTVRMALRDVGGRILFSVEDEGEGIAPEHFPKIWQKYWRAHSADGSAVAGAGIGLAVVKELVTRHHGRIRVEVRPTGGARFLIELPAAEISSRPHPPDSSDRERVPG